MMKLTFQKYATEDTRLMVESAGRVKTPAYAERLLKVIGTENTIGKFVDVTL